MRIQKNIQLGQYTTFKIGGPAYFFIRIKTLEDLYQAISFAKSKNLPIFVLGGGSNILISDRGFTGVVLKMDIKIDKNGLALKSDFLPKKFYNPASWDNYKSTKSSSKNVLLCVGAGELWDDVVRRAVQRSLYGIENLSLIPGTVGGAVYQNIGAYGAELKDVVRRVLVFDKITNRVQWLSRKNCQFGYRVSIFRTTPRYVILAAELELSKKNSLNISYSDLAGYFSHKQATLIAVRRAVMRIRRSKLPYPPAIANAGSFFKNPVISKKQFNALLRRYPDLQGRFINPQIVKLSSAQLIEKNGWKGKKVGDAGIYAEHALVLVNHNCASAQEVTKLAENIKKDVYRMFSIKLEQEVQNIEA